MKSTPHSHNMKQFKTILDVVAITTILLLPHAELIPFFGYSIPVLLVVWLILKFGKESFSDLGLSSKLFKPKIVFIGGAFGLLTLAFLQLIFHPLLDFFVSLDSEDVGLYDTIRSSRIQFLLMVVMGWLIGGLYEEIVFHGFMFTRLERMIKGPYSTQISFLITSVLFGLYHIQLGPLGVVNALVAGAIYLAVYMRFNRNLWYSIVCHGCYNTLVMILIYLGYL